MNLALNIAVVLLSLALFWCGSASAFAVPNHARNQRLTTDLPSSHSLWSNGPESTTVDDGMSDELVESSLSRRLWFDRVSRGILTAGIAGVVMSTPESAQASGGATAGRYTTIPIAKRRYYGRVQQAVHEFLDIGPAFVNKGGADMTAPNVQLFFDPQGTIIVAAKRKDVNGQCTKKDGDCKGREVRDSRYNDMKASMYLLANAFRTDQQKPPDRLPTVKAARAFFQQVNELEKLATKNPKKNDQAAVQRYIAALDILDTYLDLVELPPIDSGHYEQEFDTLVGETARIT